MRTTHLNETISQISIAQEKIIGRFCSNCRMHRKVDGGRELGGSPKRTRWVCRWCAEKYDRAQEKRDA